MQSILKSDFVSSVTQNPIQYVRDELQKLSDIEGDKPLARRLGVPLGQLRSILSGRDPLASNLFKMAKAIGAETYLGPQRQIFPDPHPIQIASTEYSQVRLFGAVDAAAGGGAEVIDETVTGTVAFRSEWLRSRGLNDKAAIMIQVRGDSMNPTIRNGDLILVNTKSKRIQDGAVYVIRHQGGLYVKRLTRFKDLGVLMASDNPEFEPVMIPAREFETGSIVGRAIWLGGDII